jgi:hypothetical protein
MRWCSFTTTSGGPARLGAVSAWDGSGKVLDVAGWARSRDAETPPDLVDLVESSPATQERVTDLVRSAPADGIGWVRPDEVVFLAPLRSPNTLRQVVAREGAVPVFTHASRRAVLGPDDQLRWPSYTEKLDFSCQVAAVVGRRGVDLSPTDALASVFGYTVMTQWSARDVGREVATAFGPWLVTPDEWEPRADHALEVAVDGESWFTGTAPGRPWTFGQALSWVSQGEELWPTDVLGLGPAAGGSGRDLGRWIQPGHQLALSIEGLGAVATRVSTTSP